MSLSLHVIVSGTSNKSKVKLTKLTFLQSGPLNLSVGKLVEKELLSQGSLFCVSE